MRRPKPPQLGPTPRVTRGTLVALVALAVLATPGAGAGAQTGGPGIVAGSVTDAQTGDPIPAAVIVVADRTRIMTGDDGRFQIAGLALGTHRFEVSRIGYVSVGIDVAITDARPRRAFDIQLSPAPPQLDPVNVRAGRSGLAGFYDRRRTGLGHFLIREEFEGWNPVRTTDVLRRVPGVRVRPNPSYGHGGDTGIPDRRRFIVETSRGGAIVFDPLAGPECPVSYWLDGMRVGNDRDDPIDDFLSVNQIEAIEAYVGIQVPPQFFHPQARCGVIAFWSRRGAESSSSGRYTTLIGGAVGVGLGVALGLASPESCNRCLFRTERFKRTVADGVVLGLAGALLGQVWPSGPVGGTVQALHSVTGPASPGTIRWGLGISLTF